MRIVAGHLRGRTFDAPKGHRTHPMSEKVRGAIFNALGDIAGLTVLDAYAGSGALGFEALSRGALGVTLIEVDKTAHSQILQNVRMLQLKQNEVKAIRANTNSWSDNNPDARFSIVICDPPYDDVHTPVLEKLSRHVKPGGLLICSLPPTVHLQRIEGFTELDRKDYGDATVQFWRRRA